MGRSDAVFVVVSGPPASGKSTLAHPIAVGLALAPLRRLPGPIVEVFCRCERAVGVARYEARAGSRHAGHFDAVRSTDDLWGEDVSEPVAGG